MTLPVHPLCTMSPDMADEQYQEFRADIAANGQREPVKLWRGQIIDGRHRARACADLGRDLLTVTIDLPEEALPAYVLSLNAMRSHLTPSQRAMYAASMANRGRVGRPSKPTKLGEFLPPSIESAAKAIGVAPSAVIAAKRVIREAAPEVAEAVKAGKLTLHAAGRIADQVPKPEQPAAVATITSQPIRRGRAVLPVTGSTFRRPPQKNEPIEALVDRALTSIEVATQALEMYAHRTKPGEEMRASWASITDRGLTALRKLRDHLKEVAA